MRLETLSTNVGSSPLGHFNRFFWTWYADHKDDTYPVPVRILGISIAVSIEMKKLKGLFAVIFGADPRDA